MRLTSRDIDGVFKALSYFPMSTWELVMYLSKTKHHFKIQSNQPLYNINKRLYKLYKAWYLNRFKNPDHIYTYYLVKRTCKEFLSELESIASTNRLFKPISLGEWEHYKMTLQLFINLKQNCNFFKEEFTLLDSYWDRQFRLYYKRDIQESKSSLIEPDLTLLIEKEWKKILLMFEVERKRKDPFKIKGDFKEVIHRRDLESLKNKYSRYQDLSELFKRGDKPLLIKHLEQKYQMIHSFIPIFITTNKGWERIYSDFFKNAYKGRYRVATIEKFKSVLTKECTTQVSNTLTKNIYFKLGKKSCLLES